MLIVHDRDPMLKAGQTADIRHIPLTNDPDAFIAGSFQGLEMFGDALACFAVQRKRMLHIIHSPTGTQGNTLRGNDLA